MSSIRSRLSILVTVIVLAAGCLCPPSSAAEGPEAWGVVSDLRSRLIEQGAHAREFEQTYVPSGFSSGESERGRVVFRLPECLRWDYAEPYPRSFLLCGELLHVWTPGDPSGQIHALDRERQPGLDLLALDADRLRERYRASATTVEGRVTVTLEPRSPESDGLRSARLTVDRDTGMLRSLAYEDDEANRTAFVFEAPTPLDSIADLFTPPDDIVWRRETTSTPSD